MHDLLHFAPDSCAGYEGSTPGNKMDPANVCLQKVKKHTFTSLLIEGGLSCEEARATSSESSMSLTDAVCIVESKDDVSDGIEPKGFCNNAGITEVDLVLPASIKHTLQVALHKLKTGERTLVTSWTSASRKIFEIDDAALVTRILIMTERVVHPEVQYHMDWLVRHIGRFLAMNKALATNINYMRRGLVPSIGQSFELMAGISTDMMSEEELALIQEGLFGGWAAWGDMRTEATELMRIGRTEEGLSPRVAEEELKKFSEKLYIVWKACQKGGNTTASYATNGAAFFRAAMKDGSKNEDEAMEELKSFNQKWHAVLLSRRGRKNGMTYKEKWDDMFVSYAFSFLCKRCIPPSLQIYIFIIIFTGTSCQVQGGEGSLQCASGVHDRRSCSPGMVG